MEKNTSLPPEIIEKVEQLALKYKAMGQNLSSYLDGLLHADYLTYWDYVHLDVLLSLQNPKTSFPDESIFIMYHQITELQFKLCLHAIQQISDNDHLDDLKFIQQITRVNTYFKSLIQSFEIMIDGMEKEQFLKFRMSLLPASGFQSVQYRMIEICATDIDRLLAERYREEIADNQGSIEEKYKYLYWKQGAVELATKRKTLTLKQFELKYAERLIKLAKKNKKQNLWQKYQDLSPQQQQNPELINQMRQFDLNANVLWPLMHYKSAVRYLNQKPKHIAATGGTNWQKYLPPKNQRIIFYPDLWTKTERKNWGKNLQKEIISS